jgi:UDP-N-acetylmuramate--alanine ligase
MTGTNSYFFCGIGGSGMLPLASIVRAQGAEVAGSDRALDQGRTAAKFEYLRSLGIRLYPQDGSGLVSGEQVLVASAAVEESVPDVQAARRLGCERVTRAELLARLFNSAETAIAVGGTSGKSTVTGMIGWILAEAGLDPTVMNGAVMKNFATPDAPFASARVGRGGAFVSEVDESDGSIALYEPEIAILTNISLDHKSMEELRTLFRGFLSRASSAILNVDDEETRSLAGEGGTSFSLSDPCADYFAAALREEPFAASFTVLERSTGDRADVRLQVPGRHNVANALAAIAASRAAGVPLGAAAEAMAGFQGLRRRFERVGERGGVTVIDDFAHNPDKIAATLATCRAAPGRLLLFFQPHGYGPLRTMGDELIAAFAGGMAEDDVLILSDPVYYGGTVERSVGSGDIAEGVRARGRRAEHVTERSDCGARLAELARPGDRILIVGARDDTLSQFAEGVLESL